MSFLTLAIRNTLAQDAELTALLGKSASWTTWIFDEKPVGVKIENTSRAMIVVSDGTPSFPNEHNTMEFPRVFVDVWVDPSRNADLSISVDDASRKLKPIQDLVNKHLHLVDPGGPGGTILQWGTAAQVASKTGVFVAGSTRVAGPDISPVRDSEGTIMARFTYEINLLS